MSSDVLGEVLVRYGSPRASGCPRLSHPGRTGALVFIGVLVCPGKLEEVSVTGSGRDRCHLLSCLPGTHAASCCPGAFAHAVLAAGKTLPPGIHMARPLTPPGLCTSAKFAGRASQSAPPTWPGPAWDLLRFHCNAALMQSVYWLSSLIVPHSTAAPWGQGLCPAQLENGQQVLPEESGEAVLQTGWLVPTHRGLLCPP